MSQTRPALWWVWQSMKARCHRPTHKSFSYYGGRGISVCASWRVSFAAFVSDVGPRPGPAMELDRVNGDGNYEPGNVRWVDRKAQVWNSRATRLVTVGGHTDSLRGWAKRIGVDQSTIVHRLRRGWPIERAVTEPARVSR